MDYEYVHWTIKYELKSLDIPSALMELWSQCRYCVLSQNAQGKEIITACFLAMILIACEAWLLSVNNLALQPLLQIDCWKKGGGHANTWGVQCMWRGIRGCFLAVHEFIKQSKMLVLWQRVTEVGAGGWQGKQPNSISILFIISPSHGSCPTSWQGTEVVNDHWSCSSCPNRPLLLTF